MRRTRGPSAAWVLALAVAAALWASPALGATAASGTVFWDANADGLRQPGEQARRACG